MNRNREGTEPELLVATEDQSFASAVVDAVERTGLAANAEYVEPATDGSTQRDTDKFDGAIVDGQIAELATVVERLTERADLPVVALSDPTGDDDPVVRAIEAGATDVFPRTTASAQYELAVERLVADRFSTSTGKGDLAYREAYEALFDKISEGLVVHDPETGVIVDVNERFCEMNGYERSELLGEPIGIVLTDQEDYGPEAAKKMIQQARTEGPQCFEWRNRRCDGETFPVEVDLTVIELDDTERVLASVQDITERKRREQEYEQIFNSVNDAITVFDPETSEITEVNEAYREMLGYDLERIRELGIEGLSANDEGYTGERGWELIREVLRTGESETVEWRAERKGGDRIWLEVTLTPAEIGGERRVLSIQRDVTERRELERTYRDIFEGVSDGLVVHDDETGEILEVNERYCELTGYDREELLEGSIELIMPADNPEYTYEDVIKRIRRAREEGPQLFEFKGERKDGEIFIGDVHLRTIEIRGTERVLASVRDITERKRREREYEQIFDGVNDAIVIQDPETAAPIDANETFLDRLEYDDVAEVRKEGLVGLSATESGYTKERAQELCRRVMETGEPEVVEWQQETKDGEDRWIEATIDSAVIQGEDRILSMQRDITERKRRQRIMRNLHTSTNELQEAESVVDVCEATVAAAREVLNLSMPICWIHGFEEPGVLSPVATSEAAWDASRGSDGPGEFEPGDFQYEVYETGEMRVYDPSEVREESPLNHGILLGLGDHGMFGAADPGVEAFDDVTLDAARILARHATAALERVERERELRESERRFRLIAERIDEVIFLATLDFSEALYVNPAYETVWGRPTDELYDDARKFLEAVDPRDRDETEAAVETMVEEMQRGEPADSYDFEYRVRQPGGEIRWVSATGYAVQMSDGEPRFVGIVEDITERKYREQRLEVFNRILRHNLRNQLDVIRSHAEALVDRTDDKCHPERIIAAVDELAAMGVRARKTDRIMSMGDGVTEVNLPETLGEVVEEITQERVTVDVATDLPASARVRNNDEALQTAARSALENAIEYADSEVRLAVEGRPGGYTVVIDDDGPGIPKGELVPIETGTETSLNHGRGLGLWQLRWGVDKLNGELSFNTDEGTTIRIGVPDRGDPAHEN